MENSFTLTRHRARLARKREIVLRAMVGGDWDGLQVLRHPAAHLSPPR